LVTTLWARLALGDLFIHGIGGAKYDRVTDMLIERFFGLSAPGIMVVSATLLLPIERNRATDDDLRAVQRQLRELVYHPERYLNRSDDASSAPIAAKRGWVETPQTAGNARQRCHAIREANLALQLRLAPLRQSLLERQTQIMRKLQAERVLASREYAFCLYPEASLRGFLAGLLHKMT
jgi:hypothetical protein